MKDDSVIGELCVGTLVKAGLHYAVVIGGVSYVCYRYLGSKTDLLHMGYTAADIADAVNVADFMKYAFETRFGMENEKDQDN